MIKQTMVDAIQRIWQRWMVTDFYSKIVRFLPSRLLSAAYIQIGVEVTTGKYEGTPVVELTMMNAIERYSRIHGHGGSGKDKYYDSNRNRNKTKEKDSFPFTDEIS